SVILGYTSLLLHGLPEGAETRPELEEIKRAADRAASLTRQLLAYGRRQVLQPSIVDLSEVVNGMEGMLTRLLGPQVQLVTRKGADLPAILVDPNQIGQVILNLAVNARDAMPKGGTLALLTGVEELDGTHELVGAGLNHGRYLVLTVSD